MRSLSTVFSYASRLNSEAETEKNLRTVGVVEFLRLGVTPQTVFLKSHSSEPGLRSSRISTPHPRRPIDVYGRAPILSPVRGNRLSSGDFGTGAPFEDLRRRLAALNGSTSSLGQGYVNRDLRSSSPLVAGPSVACTSLPAAPDRSASPTESIVSTSNSSTFRATQRLQVGSTDGQKAAPAIGSSKTNVTGLLEASSKLRQEGSPDPSGRSSPVSAAGTFRGQRPRVPSLLPIPIYGSSSALHKALS